MESKKLNPATYLKEIKFNIKEYYISLSDEDKRKFRELLDCQYLYIGDVLKQK